MSPRSLQERRQDPNAQVRFDLCEELFSSPRITSEQAAALIELAHDSNLSVATRASMALQKHALPVPEGNSHPASARPPAANPQPSTKQCPYCAETIRA